MPLPADIPPSHDPGHRPDPSLRFLSGGGAMGALMRRHDWSSSSLGPPALWPQSLRTVVRLMLNTGHPMYIWWGPELACLYNDAYCESIGPERHPGSLGRPAREVWEEIWPIIGPQIEHVLSGQGATWNVDHLVPITRHGRREDVYWTYSYSPIDDEQAPGGIGGVLVVCTETTRQIQSAMRVAAERDQLGRLFEQAPIFMALLSGPQHRFEIINPRYQDLVGHRQVLGRTVGEALPEAVGQGYLALLDRVYRSGEPYIATGAPYARQAEPGGPVSARQVDFVYQPIKGEDGRVSGIFVVGTDVTERNLAEAALRESESRHRQLSEELARTNQAKDEFLATLAHELRNPLAPMRNALALLAKAAGDPAIHTTSLDILGRQLAQMVRLIDDLLDVSRLSRGLVELRREHVPLARIVHDAIETSRPLIDQHRHELVVVLPPGELVVHADPTRIVQALTNLLNNAAKFTPRGGRLQVAITQDEGQATVSVTDNGIGIPADMLGRIFDMFTQVERSYAATAGGLGIGLTLVRKLVELHGGQVTAESAGKGLGSAFHLRLPLAGPAPAPPPTASGDGAVSAAVAPLRIVVADDNVDAASSLALALTLSGHEAVAVHDGAQALEAGRALQAQVLVVDIAMPLLDGHAVARQARAEPWGRQALLVALSGWGQPEDRERSRAAGFDHHLVKPLALNELERLLARHAGA